MSPRKFRTYGLPKCDVCEQFQGPTLNRKDVDITVYFRVGSVFYVHRIFRGSADKLNVISVGGPA